MADPAGQAGVDASRIDFEELWEHRESLRAICLRMTDDPTTADDVVQETFLRALAHAETLDKRASFAPWLATVARRRSVDEIRLRRRVRPVATTLELEAGEAEDPAEQVLKQEMVRRLRIALGELSTRERQMLLRQVTHGLSLAELAEEEDTSIASVRSVLNRARTKLRGSLERGGPLGTAPLPRLVAAVKRRLHGVAARLEGHAPLLGGAGAQLGDVVAAAIAAFALLVAGAPAPEANTTFLSQVPVVASSESGGEPPSSATTTTTVRGGAPASVTVSNPVPPPEDEQTPAGIVPPVQLPTLSDGAEQPEDALAETMAASDDGTTLIVTGWTTPAGGNASANGQVAMYRSDDSGRTWRRTDSGSLTTIGRVLLPPAFPQVPTFFIDDDRALRRTDDGGGTFSLPLSTTRGLAAISPRYRAGDHRIFVGAAGLASYDTDEERVTPFTAVPVLMTSFGSLAFPARFAQDETVLIGAGGRPQGSFRGYVQSCTPRECAPARELPGALEAPQIMVSSSVPGLIVAWTRHTLYRSFDDGQSFTSVSVPAGGDIRSVVDGPTGELLLARINTGKTSGSGVFRSRDGGTTWSPLGTETALQQGARSIAYLKTGRILAGKVTGPGILCSADGGVTWAPRCP